jgi:hypothetical protein
LRAYYYCTPKRPSGGSWFTAGIAGYFIKLVNLFFYGLFDLLELFTYLFQLDRPCFSVNYKPGYEPVP